MTRASGCYRHPYINSLCIKFYGEIRKIQTNKKRRSFLTKQKANPRSTSFLSFSAGSERNSCSGFQACICARSERKSPGNFLFIFLCLTGIQFPGTKLFNLFLSDPAEIPGVLSPGVFRDFIKKRLLKNEEVLIIRFSSFLRKTIQASTPRIQIIYLYSI